MLAEFAVIPLDCERIGTLGARVVYFSERMGRLVFALCFVAFVGCDDEIVESPVRALEKQADASPAPTSTDGGHAAHVVPAAECVGRCCPAASACYPQGDAGKYSGPECLAQRDNTGQDHWQLRQTMSVSTNPPGNAETIVANQLVRWSELKWPLCNASQGASGFIQLLDLDRSTNTSRVGFAKYEPDAPTALKSGLCFVEDTYDDPMWRLSGITTPPNWPLGLPPPQSLPWKIQVVTASRETTDFDVTTSEGRAAALARFDPATGDLAAKGFNGLFFMDENAGYVHGYAPITYILLYTDQKTYEAIPIRESELTIQMNDPAHPNCAGIFLGNNPDLPSSCVGDATSRAWGCPEKGCPPGQIAPDTVQGYFLLTDLEQVYDPTLTQTLCEFMPGPNGYPGWKLDVSCRSDSARWNPSDPVHGLPPGDWCAETNSVANDECHDALRSISFSTFQAFPIQSGTCSAL